jgi:transposase
VTNWIHGINFSAGTLTAKTSKGTLLELSQLAKAGLPTDRSTRVGRLEIEFGAWAPISSAAYRKAFHIKLEEGTACQHDVFEAQARGVTLVVPALVFLRAIFKPNAQFLARAFAPQLMDFAAYLDRDQDPPQIKADPTLPAVALSSRQSNPLQTLAWLYCHPSARNMVGSVHVRALGGAMSLAMPEGKATLAVHGKKIGRTLFVTAMSINSVTPADTPVVTCDLTAKKYLLRGTRMEAEESRAVHTKRLTVPARSDGGVELTDGEWVQVEAILAGSRRNRTRLSQRAVADGVLTKLHTGQPWSKVGYREGFAQNAISALHRWKITGRFDALLDVLHAHRNVTAAAHPVHDANPARVDALDVQGANELAYPSGDESTPFAARFEATTVGASVLSR